MNTSTIVQKLWNYCNVLRDDGMSYGDYVEQLAYLLFLKMADERTRQLLLRCSTFHHPWRSQARYNQKSPVPEKYSWPSLASTLTLPRKPGRGLVFEALGNQKGLLGLIFNKSQNKFDSAHPWASACGRAARAQICSGQICQDPTKLRRLVVDLIDDDRGIESLKILPLG